MFSLSAVLCVSILGIGSQSGLAQSLQPLQPQEPDWLIRMYDDGWQKMQEGVLQRGEGGGRVETFTYGAEGLRWHIAGLEERLDFLEGLYHDQPNPDLASTIDHFRGELLDSTVRLESGQVGDPFAADQLNDGCDVAYGGDASADPLVGAQAPGVTASANAYFHNTCGYVGNTYAFAYVEATAGTVSSTKTQEDPRYDGTWLDSTAQWSLGGSTGCYSTAYASVTVHQLPELNINYEVDDTNYDCPAPLEVQVSGPGSLSLDYSTPCGDVTWTAAVSGGKTPYTTIDWYLGTTLVGSGPSYTQNFCSASQTVIAKAVVSDSASQTAQATQSTAMTYTPPPALQITLSGGPTSVALDGATPCKDVTWTAAVSGGVPPYSPINWYLGTTLVGTGSSYTKNYCTTSQTVTAKATVADSAGQTAQATQTTAITYTPPPALLISVSGPTSVALDGATTCKNVTWTAAVSGGLTPYGTINWYLGTTLVGTGSSYTKNYCTTSQTVTAKAIVTDSASQTAQATKTTTITYTAPAALQITVSGPTSVALNGTTPCKDVTWTAAVSGGFTPYGTIKWYLGTTLVGSGASYTKNYCSTSQTVTAKATVTDNASQTAQATKMTTITYTPPALQIAVSGPDAILLTASVPCKNVTWTASASGGVTPYGTIKWYLGTSTTSVGTGSSFTKNYCTAQTVTAKAVVTDTAGQTASGTKTTNVTAPEPSCSPGDCNCINSNFTAPENSPSYLPITEPCTFK
jgi:hypothetical protein